MKNISKVIILGIAAVFMVTACTRKQAGNTDFDIGGLKYGSQYPLQTDETLTWWMMMPLNPEYTNYKEQPIFQQIMRQTGVEIEFRLPSPGQVGEAFNLMIASNDLTDIITHNWATNAGGPLKYLDGNYIIPLNSVFASCAPNISKYLSEHPYEDKQVKLDDGTYYCFPTLMNESKYRTTCGPIIRKDLLDKFNIEVPETIGDWHSMLKVFKENGIKYPLTLANENYFLSAAVNAYHAYYLEDDGTVKYGPIEKEWMDYINLMQKWYSEGLIDADFGSIADDITERKMAVGESAATVVYGSAIGRCLSAGQKLNENYDLIGVKYPSANKEEIPKFGQRANTYQGYGCSAISTQCSNVELAAKVLDFIYTDAGRMLTNFGIEGESYVMKNGYPAFTDKMYVNGALINHQKYTWSHATITSIYDGRVYEQTLSFPQQKKAIGQWEQTNMEKHLLPLLIPNSEESASIEGIQIQLNDYLNEFFYTSVCNKEQLTNTKFNDYVKDMKQLGIDNMLKIQQNIYTRFQRR